MKLSAKTITRLLTMVVLMFILCMSVHGTTIEQMPSYPGGEKALLDYFQKNLQCPKEVKRAKVHGNVKLSFVIMRDGFVGDVKTIETVLLKKSGVLCKDPTLIKLCEQEAVRVCRNMRRWIPGKQFGFAHKTKFLMSIVFNDPSKEACDIYYGEEIWDEDHLTNMIDVIKFNYLWRDTLGRLSVTEEMKMEYCTPEGFSEDDSEENFIGLSNQLLATFSFNGLRPQLHSDDGQFIAFLQFAPIYTKIDEKRRRWIFRDFPKEELFNKYHLWKMRAIIKKYYSCNYFCENDDLWRDSITVLSTEEARSKWNADSAFVFNLHLRPEDYYKKDFKHVKILLIQKKGRGYAYITSFYTDKAKENFDKYWRRIKKTLRYED